MSDLPELILTVSDVVELFAAAVDRCEFDHAAELAGVILTKNDERGGG